MCALNQQVFSNSATAEMTCMISLQSSLSTFSQTIDIATELFVATVNASDKLWTEASSHEPHRHKTGRKSWHSYPPLKILLTFQAWHIP